MFGIIATPDMKQDILDVIQGEEVLFEKIGIFEPDDFISTCSAAASVLLETLIIDLSCCPSNEAIIKGIRKYRMSRNARIVVIAPGKQPGDPTISALVSIGVYDIVAPSLPSSNEEGGEDEAEEIDFRSDLSHQLRLTYSYGNAARWHTNTFEVPVEKNRRFSLKDFGKEPVSKKEQVIYRDLVGKVIIAVGGIDRKTGSTHVSIQLAQFLKHVGHSAVCVERVDSNLSPRAFHLFPKDKTIPYGFSLEGVDYIPNADLQAYLEILGQDHKYVILDMGSLFKKEEHGIIYHEHAEDFLRADVSIVTTSVSLGDFRQLVDFFKAVSWKKTIHVCVNLSSPETFYQFKKSFESQVGSCLLFANEFQPDPFLESSGNMWSELLKEVLPDRKQSKKWFSIFRRG